MKKLLKPQWLLMLLLLVSYNAVLAQDYLPFKKNNALHRQNTLPQRTVNQIAPGVFEVTYFFTGADVSRIKNETDVYQHLHIQGFGKMNQIGAPAIPAHNDFIATPGSKTPTISVEEAIYIEVSPFMIHPKLAPARDTEGAAPPQFVIDTAIYSKDAFFPEKVVTLEKVHEYRDIPLAMTQIRPVQFNPVTKTLRLYSTIKYKVDYQLQTEQTIAAVEQSSPHSLNLLKRSVLNPEVINSTLTPQREGSSTDGKNYIIVGHSEYTEAAHHLAQWKRQLGYSVEVVLKDNWTPSQVESAIHSRYHNWTLKPDYFVIIGDHDGPFAVPGMIRQDPNDGDDFATDLYYACFDGEGDYYPDIAHGRISVSSAEEAMTIVEKIVNYERNPVDNPSFYQNGLNCAQFQDVAAYEAPDGIAARRFCHTSEDIREYVINQGYEVERIYYTDEGNTPEFFNDGHYSNKEPIPEELLRSNGFAWDGDAQDILTSLNQGKFYLFHRDHGYSGGIGWAHPQFLSNNSAGYESHVAQLQNGDLLPVVFSINCHTGEFALEECFAEEFLRHPNGGAVGVVAASYYSYSGYNDGFSAGMVDAIWSEPGLTPVFGSGGVEDPPASSANNIRTMGDVVNQGLVRMIETWGDNQYTHELFHWFGDPAMRIWTEDPNTQTITATAPTSIACDGTSITVTNCSTEEALVTLIDGNKLITQGVIADGQATLNFPQQYYESPLVLTISKGNHKPFIQNIELTGECNFPPVADFSASSQSIVMESSVSFTDQSTANPTAWEWTFEGGIPASSTEQNPVVTYETPGSYDVTLRVTNENGSDTHVETDYITVTLPEYCDASGGGGFYISEISFNTLSHNSGQESYADNTDISTTVIPGNTYPLNISLSGYLTHWAENGVWIDWNNDGDFDDTNEEVANTENLSMDISIPADAPVGEHRMRIRTTDESVVPCGNSGMGEVEDYLIIIKDTQTNTYNVTFNVTDGTDPIEGATVSLTGYGQATTDASGEATFAEVAPENDIDYTVEAAGYNQEQGTVSIVNQDVTEEVALTLTTYNVTFNVTDGTDPIEGATVSLTGYGQATTDAAGQATFAEVAPENDIAYTVEATGYNQEQGTVSVVDLDVTEEVALTLTTYNVTFNVSDGTDPIEGATVSLTGYGQATTDASGEATFAEVAPENDIDYTVEAAGYNQEQGTVSIVDQDVTEQVALNLTTFNVTFNVTDGTDPIEGATISLTGYGQATTDASGEATFAEVAPENDIDYTIEAVGYEQYQSNLSVVDQDVSISVDLTLNTYAVTFVVSDGTTAIAGATVSLDGSGQGVTNADGEVIFENVVPSEGIAYTVEAAGFDQAEGSVSVVDQDVLEQVALTLTTFNVTFAVNDGTDPVQGATVSLTGYGQATTDASGEATFAEVAPENDIDYTVEAAGYNQEQGTVSIVDQDVTEQVALNLTTFNVTFNVTDGTDPIEGATISLTGYGQATTDAAGQAIFGEVVPENDIAYTIEAAGYNQEQGNVSVVDQDVTEEVALTLTTYNVTFNVTDGTDPVEGATVSLTGYGQATTNADGEANFSNVLPTQNINYTIEAVGYEQYQSNLSVVDQDVSISVDLTLNTYAVTFVVSDGTTAIAGATVSLDGSGQGVTNADGEVIFENVVPSEGIAYTVEAAGFDQAEGSVSVVDQDVLETVSLTAQTYNITFAVNDGTDPIQGATVSLTGYGQATTDAAGEATFTAVTPEDNIAYTVEAAGFNQAQGTVSVVDQDVTEQVALTLTAYSVTFAVSDGTDPIQGATVNLTGYGQATTDAAGEATFASVAPEDNIDYTVEAAGFNQAQGTVSVVDQDVLETVSLTAQTYNVTFAVNDGTDPIQGATVSLTGYGQVTTDAAGEVTFASIVPEDNIAYTVEAAGFNQALGTVSVVDQDVTEQVALTPTTYNVTFAVNDGTDPIQGATISLTGYGQATTNAAGEATFASVAPEDNIDYTVEAAGFNQAQGTVSVVDQDVTEQVALTLTAYSVTFAVNDGNDPIQGATVSLTGYGQVTTDAAGEATFATIVPEDNIAYTVEAAGFNQAQGMVSVVDQDVTEQVALTLTTFNVTFAVNDGTDPVQGATVSLTGYGQATTDAAGEATFASVAPEDNIAYTVEAAGFNQAQGTVSVIDQNVLETVSLTAQTYNITFAVNDGTDPIQGATVSLTGYGQVTTDAAGEATFTAVTPEDNIAYTVDAAGFDQAEGSVSVVDQDVLETVSLTAHTYNITFAVNDGTDPIQGATMSLTGYGQVTTDAAGEATFTAVTPEDNIAYTVDAAGFDQAEGSVSVVDQDVTEQVALTLTTFNVTFAVNNGTDPIQGATISLTGYGQATTDAAGEATFASVAPEDNIAYTVEAAGFNQAQGTVSVIDQNVLETVSLTAQTYNITFAVNDGTDPIQGATVSLTGYGQATTDVAGEATFASVAPEDNIAYTVEAAGFNQAQGTVSVVDQDVTEQVTLTSSTYNVTFAVNDGTDPIQGATINLTGYGQVTTDAAGEAIFTAVTPEDNIAYTVEAAGFNQAQGTVSVVDQDVTEQVALTLTTFNVTFAVNDGTDPVQGATVSLTGYGQATTDAAGEATFTAVTPEDDIAYSVEAAGFSQAQGTVSVVDKDVTEQVTLTSSTYNVTFAVNDGTDPIQGATVSLTGYGQVTTDAAGEAVFSNVYSEANIPYSIEADGFETVSESITVNENIRKEVTLTAVSTGIAYLLSDLSLYPNPADEHFALKTDLEGPFSIKIFNNLGHLEKGFEEVNRLEDIYINDLPQGVYFIRIEFDGKVQTRRLIKQ